MENNFIQSPMKSRTNIQIVWKQIYVVRGNSYKYFEEPCAKYAEKITSVINDKEGATSYSILKLCNDL